MGPFRRRKVQLSVRAALWGGFLVPYMLIMTVVAFAGIGIGVPISAGAASTNVLCQFNVGCMSKGMCDQAKGGLVSCPNLGGQCKQNGWGLCYPPQTAVGIKIAIMGHTSVLDFGEYIGLAYKWAVGAAAVVAAVMLMIGGFQYMTAGGSGRINAAKKRITDSLIGLALIAFAWLILNTINPALTNLVVPRIPLVPPRRFVQCDAFKFQKRCGLPFGLALKPNMPPGTEPKDMYNVVAIDDPNVVATCTGASCTLAGKWDATSVCVPGPVTAGATGATSGTAAGGATTSSSSTSSSTSSASSASASSSSVPATGAVPPYSCQPCKPQGATCTGLGPSSQCCGGYCGSSHSTTRQIGGQFASLAGVSGNCSNGNDGVACGDDSECFSGHCADIGHSPGGICVAGKVGSPCSDDSDCNSGLVCLEKTGLHICVIPQMGGPCVDDSDCPSGIQCVSNRCGRKVPCKTDKDCQEQGAQFGPDYRCWTDAGICKMFEPGSVCYVGGMDECSDSTYGKGFCCDNCLSDHEYAHTLTLGLLGHANAGICVVASSGVSCDGDADCTNTLGPSAYCNDTSHQSTWIKVLSPAVALYNYMATPNICVGGIQPGEPCSPHNNDPNKGGCVSKDGIKYICAEGVFKCVRPEPAKTGG